MMLVLLFFLLFFFGGVRFHVVSEFDDSKRSCRRRLAGHNERRRKSANEFVPRNPPQGSLSLSHVFYDVKGRGSSSLLFVVVVACYEILY